MASFHLGYYSRIKTRIITWTHTQQILYISIMSLLPLLALLCLVGTSSAAKRCARPRWEKEIAASAVGIDLDRRALAHRAPRLDPHSRYALRSFAR